MTIKIQNNPVIYEDRTLRVADGSTAERPESPEAGMIRFNTTLQLFEGYDGTKWVDFDKAPFPPYAWGVGANGRLGTGDTTNQSSPVKVAGGIKNWSQVSAGERHSLGVTDSGVAYAWGYGTYGRLATNNTIAQSSPVTVVGEITNWSQVSAGGLHSLGITEAGVAYGWGNDFNGELGSSDRLRRSSPVTVVGGITNWSQVSAGFSHSLGVTQTGIAYAWGYGDFGQLGIGPAGFLVRRSSPVAVTGGITNWSQVSAGGGFFTHSLGVTDTGIAYAWGYGSSGQVGDGTRVARSSPVAVTGGITDWRQVSAGGIHSLGVTDNGIAYAWGNNNQGQLGDGTTANRSSPVTVVGGITNWSQVSAGGQHSIGVTDSGVAYAWGDSSSGRLGTSTTVNQSSPVTVVGGITNWSQVSAGDGHNLGLRTT